MWEHARFRLPSIGERTEGSLRGGICTAKPDNARRKKAFKLVVAEAAASLPQTRPHRRPEKLQGCRKVYTVVAKPWTRAVQFLARAGEI